MFAGRVVGDVVAAHGEAHLDCVLAPGPAHVVIELVAGYVAALGEGKVFIADQVAILTVIDIQVPVTTAGGKSFWNQNERNGCGQAGPIGVGEDGAIIARRKQELVGQSRRKWVGFV